MKGILFKPDMIRAIVEGKKTQTRRVIKPQPYDDARLIEACGVQSLEIDGEFRNLPKPRYQVGEVLYIKEGYEYVSLAEKDPWKDKAIADGSFRRKPDGSLVRMCYKLDGYEIGADWLTPMFMPAWAARYFIRITDVRAGRLNEITDVEARREGIPNSAYAVNGITSFKRLWDSINKSPFDWEANPWVWVYSFERFNGTT